MTRAAGIGPLPDLLEAWQGERSLAAVFDDANLPLGVIQKCHYQIPLSALARLYQAAAERTLNPTFGLTAGLAMSPADYGDWIYYAVQAPTLAEGISRLIKTLHFHQDGTEMRLTLRNDGAIAWEYWHPDICKPLFRQHSDHLLPGMIRFVQMFLGQDWRPSRIEVGYPAPLHTQGLEDKTETPWLFDCPCAAIVIPFDQFKSAGANMKNWPSATPILTYADVAAGAAPDWPDITVNKTASIIALRLLDGNCDIEGAAEMLGTGCRTLQRKLTDQGLNYRSLLTHVRMNRAKALIEETPFPLKRVCAEAGYSDPAHFARAFRRYFGYPPSKLNKITAGA